MTVGVVMVVVGCGDAAVGAVVGGVGGVDTAAAGGFDDAVAGDVIDGVRMGRSGYEKGIANGRDARNRLVAVVENDQKKRQGEGGVEASDGQLWDFVQTGCSE